MVLREPRALAFASPALMDGLKNSKRSLDVCFSRVSYYASAQPSQLSMASPLESPTVFEPVVNMPALSAFLFVAVVFSLLQLRINTVSKAAERRRDALEILREVKSKELSSEGEISAEEVANAVTSYQQALEEEESSRTIIPGVRIVTPTNAPSKEDMAAAKQFLGVDLDPDSGSRDEKQGDGLPPAAVGLLAIVGFSQLALLYMLSFDPMATSATFQ